MSGPVPPPAPDELSAVRRAAKQAKLPLVSGKASVAALLLCFVLSAVAVLVASLTLHLPPWIDFEIMLALWWLVWIVALARLLYQGARITDDRDGTGHVGRPLSGNEKRGGGGGDWPWSVGELGSVGDAEGCLFAVGIVLAAIAMIVFAWLLIEFIVPLLSIVLYGLVRGMLARIVNDDHGCRHRLGKSVLWGTVWATVYTGPLASLVWVVHAIVVYNKTGGLL